MANTIETRNAVRVPFLDLKLQMKRLGSGLREAVWSTLESAAFIEGKPVLEFERAFAVYCGTSDAVAVDSGTAALHLALHALGVAQGDEVVVPANTFIATAAPVHQVGARPVFVDSDEHSWQMDIQQVKRAIGPRCRAVIAVHLYGQPLLVRELRSICDEKNVPLIEDAAQAHGARYGKEKIGGFGRLACFSFYPGKNLGAYGDGGMITTNDTDLATRLRRLRNHGRTTKYEHSEVGFNYRMDAVQATVLNFKLPFLDDWNASRRYWAGRYRERLSATPLTLPALIPDTEPVYHLFTVRCTCRDKLASFLAERAIETGVHYPVPLHLQPAFRFLGYSEADFPVAEAICREIISLPIFPEMTEHQFEHVCESIDEFFATTPGR
ncbi:MAG: erythromycin biosynthesis sensory transduction protein eryC1 [Acidobacteria bacterium]|nr:MAG: erythromycin biosynthesis sensory transduction protein eryC1 [Acidobacteriota bacterium]